MLKTLAIALWLCILIVPLAAQSTSGTIVGTVTDPTGAVVAGANVTVTNQGTGIALKTTTDSTGNYVLTPVAVGTYSVTVESAGFKKSVSSNITVNVQDRVRVDAALQVGEIVDTVEVAASAPLLQTDTSYLGQVVESQRIVDLPLNGRYFSRLAILTAGTAPTPAGARDEKTGGFSSNGVRPYQNNYLLDGVDNNSMSEDMVNQASYVVGPPPDAIAEFKVQTNSMSAEFGRSGGAVLNVTIKSGTNALHGTVYEFLRNSALDAKNFFDSPSDPIPPFKLNQFGFSTGGPVVKNRTFFFFDYQGTRQRTGHTFFATLPPPAWRNGDFSGFRPIFDPATTAVDANGNAVRQPFANNQIPQDHWNPIAKKLMDAFPAPNITGSVDETGVSNNYLTNPVEPDTTNHFDVRIDHKISDSDSIFGRLSFSNNHLTPPGAIPPPLDAADFASGDFLNNARNVVITETHIFTPRTVNELRLGYSRNRSERLQFNSDKNLSQEFGIPGVPFGPTNGGLPQFNVDGLNSFGSAEYQPTVEIQNVYHIVDSLSLIRGRHTIKIGAEIKPRVNFTILQPPYPRGELNFSGNGTHDANPDNDSGLGAADLLLGRLDSAILSSFIDDTFQQPGQFYFVQDDFKVTKKLTLNLGLRYEFVTFAMEKYNAEANFNIKTNTLDIAGGRQDPLPPSWYPQIAVNRNAPRSLVPNEKHDFGPRLGFAYNLRNRTVVRGGYGLFYSSYEAGPLSIPNPGNNPPFFNQTTYPSISFLQPNAKVNSLSQGFPADALTNPDQPSLFSLDPNFHNPYVQHWNFSVQQDLGWNAVWEISYAGSKGTKLYEFREANPVRPSTDPNADSASRRPRPYLGDLAYWCACNSSHYHALQTKVEKRFSQGLSFLTAYTFGKVIDEKSQASLGFHSGGNPRSPEHPDWEKSRADFDIKHRFVNSLSYTLPIGKGKRFASGLHGVGQALLGGWELQGIQAVNTGVPRTVRSRNLSNGSGEGRPNRIAGVSLYPANRGPDAWFNKDAFDFATFGTFGNSGRNILSTATQVNIDMSVFKDFAITESKKIQFRSEFFNMINHPNFRSDSLNVRFDQSGGGVYDSAWPSRQIQFALKFIY
jgi:hypothetical protein